MTSTLTVVLQNGGGGSVLQLIPSLLLTGLIFAGFWKVFEKAGEPGWAAIVPLYNLYVLVRVSDNAWWWAVIMFIPIMQLFAAIKVSVDVASVFDKGVLFGFGLLLFPFLLYPLLGFGSAEYRGTPGDA